MISIIYIAIGGALGALSRWGMTVGVSSFIQTPYPYGTMSVNILGSFIMGALLAYFMREESLISDEVRMFLTVGFLGSFTTFSTFSADAVTLLMRGEIISAASYIFASVILSIGAVILGTFLVWKITV